MNSCELQFSVVFFCVTPEPDMEFHYVHIWDYFVRNCNSKCLDDEFLTECKRREALKCGNTSSTPPSASRPRPVISGVCEFTIVNSDSIESLIDNIYDAGFHRRFANNGILLWILRLTIKHQWPLEVFFVASHIYNASLHEFNRESPSEPQRILQQHSGREESDQSYSMATGALLTALSTFVAVDGQELSLGKIQSDSYKLNLDTVATWFSYYSTTIADRSLYRLTAVDFLGFFTTRFYCYASQIAAILRLSDNPFFILVSRKEDLVPADFSLCYIALQSHIPQNEKSRTFAKENTALTSIWASCLSVAILAHFNRLENSLSSYSVVCAVFLKLLLHYTDREYASDDEKIRICRLLANLDYEKDLQLIEEYTLYLLSDAAHAFQCDTSISQREYSGRDFTER